MRLNTIYQGNTIEVLRKLPAESIDMCITSPPYWGTRHYDAERIIWDEDTSCNHNFDDGNDGNQFCSKCGAWKGQLGQEPALKLYVKHIVAVMDEVRRVLKKEGTCWLNLGDTYASGELGRHDKNYGGEFDRPKWKGIKRQHASLDSGVPSGCITNMPARVAIEMTDNHGWIERNAVIWHKPNAMPDGAKNRFTMDYEVLYLFTKGSKYYFQQILEPSTECLKSPKKLKAKMRNKRSVWSIPVQPFSKAHFAVFPEKLIEIPIQAGCPPGGVVLDPFMGSGTVAIVASRMSRNYVGIELSEKYVRIAHERLCQHRTSRSCRGSRMIRSQENSSNSSICTTSGSMIPGPINQF